MGKRATLSPLLGVDFLSELSLEKWQQIYHLTALSQTQTGSERLRFYGREVSVM